MEFSMQIISDDTTVRSNTLKDLKDFNLQALASQVKKRSSISFFDAYAC